MQIDKEKFFAEKMKKIDEAFEKATENFPIDLLKNEDLRTVMKTMFSTGFGAGMVEAASEMNKIWDDMTKKFKKEDNG